MLFLTIRKSNGQAVSKKVAVGCKKVECPCCQLGDTLRVRLNQKCDICGVTVERILTVFEGGAKITETTASQLELLLGQAVVVK